jgi:hydrocephalus-inducing protein
MFHISCLQTFSIPEQRITVPFLLVGLVSEPRVLFDRPAISFGQVLVAGARGHATLTLLNQEDMPFTFTLDKASYDASDQQVASTGRRPVLEFEPSSGTIPPQVGADESHLQNKPVLTC